MTNTSEANSSASIASKIASAKRIGSGLCIIIFPIMLFVGFVTHPNILSLGMVTDYVEWTSEWRTSDMFHIGHLLVMFAVPLIIVACVRFMSLPQGVGAWYGFVGAILSVFGAFMLAVDKGALTFVLTAFRDLPQEEFEASAPAIEAIFNRGGWLWITWGFATLPLGVALQTIGMLKEKIIPRWQGFCIIAGLLLLINPDIEIISSAGALLMCVGFIPIGWRELWGSSIVSRSGEGR